MYAEETGWQLGRHENVYVNLEKTMIEAVLAPKSFVNTMETLLYAGGKDAISQILYGSGAPHFHPQLLLETFWNFEFPEMESLSGTYTITEDDKRKILGENLETAHNLDFDTIKRQIADDEYSGRNSIAEPYSTTDFEGVPA